MQRAAAHSWEAPSAKRSKDGDVNDAVDEENKEGKAKTTKQKTTPLKTKKVIQKRNINPTKQQMLNRLRKAGGLMKRPSAAEESDVEDLGGDAAAVKNDGEATLEPAHGRKTNDAVDEEKKEVEAKTTKLKTLPLKTKKVKPTLTKKKLKTTKLKTKPLKTKKGKPTVTKKISRPMKTGSLSKLAADAKRASKDGDVNDAVDEDKEKKGKTAKAAAKKKGKTTKTTKLKTTKLKTKPLKTKKGKTAKAAAKKKSKNTDVSMKDEAEAASEEVVKRPAAEGSGDEDDADDGCFLPPTSSFADKVMEFFAV